MVEFKIPVTRFAEAWCLKYIGPRLYYIHNKIGGEGWQIKSKNRELFLAIEDDKKALMAMMTIGDKE